MSNYKYEDVEKLRKENMADYLVVHGTEIAAHFSGLIAAVDFPEIFPVVTEFMGVFSPLLNLFLKVMAESDERELNADNNLENKHCEIILSALLIAPLENMNKQDARALEVAFKENMRKIADILSSSFSSHTSYISPKRGKEHLLTLYTESYKKLIKDIPQLRLDGAETLAPKAFLWYNKLCREMQSKSRIFYLWYDGQKKEAISEQIDGIELPHSRVVPNSLMRHVPDNEYLNQDLLVLGDEECTISARPMQDKEEEWWRQLSAILKDGPMLLLASGGMGKTTFLSYLYHSIKDKTNKMFGGVIYMTLYSVINTTEKPSTDDMPFFNATESLIMKRISVSSGGETEAGGWLRLLTSQNGNQPILVLLDGLNELEAKGQTNPYAYTQIIREIKELANQTHFPGVRVIVTSRRESNKRAEDQNKSEKDNEKRGDIEYSRILNDDEEKLLFRIARLTGVSGNYLEKIHGDEMKELLSRPLYYRYFHNKYDEENLPRTKYQALREMYEVLCRQCQQNLNLSSKIQDITLLLRYYLPIVANNMVLNGNMGFNIIPYYDNAFLGEINCALMTVAGYALGKNQLKILINEAIPVLAKRENLLFNDGTGYQFVHQDFRDFLAALYYLDRIGLMLSNPDDIIWSPEEPGPIRGMDFAEFSSDIDSLIYSALDIDNLNEQNLIDYRNRFLLLGRKLKHAHILLEYAAIQLEDYYNKRKATIALLRNATQEIIYPIREYFINFPEKLNRFNEYQRRILDQIFIKSAELFRREREFCNARDSLSLVRNGLEANHARAKIDIEEAYSVPNAQDSDQKLLDALETLYFCACPESGSPYVFSSNLLARLLTSPQPDIKSRRSFREFLKHHNLESEAAQFEKSFWIYYRAIYQNDLEDGKWKNLRYTAEQLIRLLAENKIEVTILNSSVLHAEGLHRRCDRNECKVKAVTQGSSLPSVINTTLIEEILSNIRPYVAGSFIKYMDGLIAYNKNEIEKAIEYFSGSADTRAKMLLAYLKEDRDELMKVYQKSQWEAENGQGGRQPYENYNSFEYFERDIGRLYKELITRLGGGK